MIGRIWPPEEMRRHLTNRWSARVEDKVPHSYGSARSAQLSR